MRLPSRTAERPSRCRQVRAVVRHEHVILGSDGARLALERRGGRVLAIEQGERVGECTDPHVLFGHIEHPLRLGPQMPPQRGIVAAERHAFDTQERIHRIDRRPER